MTLGIGVIGLGFMGQTHIRAYGLAHDQCRLAGVFDLDPSRLSGRAGPAGNIDTGADAGVLFDPAEVFATDSLDALLARPDIEAVSVCTPTDTHTAIAAAALRAGKHVLVEKPVSLHRAEIESLAAEAERAGRLCMPAMCIRFWPAWAWLAHRVRDRALGAVRSLWFERLGTAPGWSKGFYDDPGRSGGALHDLHIHDTDFVCSLLGPPDAVTSVGDRGRLTTIYHFREGPTHVAASGGWLRGGVSFRMRYVAEFERGSADFDLTRDPALVLTTIDHSEAEPVRVSEESGYDAEIRAFLGAIAAGGPLPVTLADAAATLAVLDAESRSLTSGRRERVT